jgi:alpha-tubulin suppressor-like RCC1 family protein
MNAASILDLSVSWRWLRRLCSTVPLGLTLLVASTGSARAETHAKETRSELVMASGSSHTCVISSDGTVKCWGSNSYGQLGNGTLYDAQIPTLVPSLNNVIALAAGDSHTCALIANGTIKCWGDNSQGQLGIGQGQLGIGSFTPSSLPVPVSNIGVGSNVGAIAIAAGAMHTCALLGDGTVTCWGDNDQYQLGNNTTVDVNAPTATPTPVPGFDDATAITAGADHTCALRNTGQVWCWGRNGSGQIGDGTNAARPQPVAASHIVQAAGEQAVVIAISAGRLHTCALALVRETASGTPNSRVECWGSNDSGQLGNGTKQSSNVPVWASGLSGVQSLAANGDHTCALLATGALMCWGDNASGQAGNNTIGTLSGAPPTYTNGVNLTPTAVTVGTVPVRLASLGYSSTCSVLADGTVSCWGNNWRSQLGNGVFTGSKVPAVVGGLAGVSGGAQVASGDAHTCALMSNGHVKCWGINTYGQLGRATGAGLPSAAIAAEVSNITNAVSLCAGTYHSCALLAGGTVECWGNNSYGQLGVSPLALTVNPPSAPVTSVANAVGIACGNSHTCASIADGTIKCWGYNSDGEMGNNTFGGSSQIPVNVTLSNGTIADMSRSVAAGGRHNCATSAAGAVTCWGYNAQGGLGDNSTLQRNTPVATSMPGVTVRTLELGYMHSCAVISDGTLQCWGENSHGALGNGSTTRSLIPINVPAFTGAGVVTAVSAGDGFTCARRVNGALWCWGTNGSGELGAPANLSTNSPAAVLANVGGRALQYGTITAAGGDHTCALFGDGGAECWGLNGSGQLGRNSLIDSYQPGYVLGTTLVHAFP